MCLLLVKQKLKKQNKAEKAKAAKKERSAEDVRFFEEQRAEAIARFNRDPDSAGRIYDDVIAALNCRVSSATTQKLLMERDGGGPSRSTAESLAPKASLELTSPRAASFACSAASVAPELTNALAASGFAVVHSRRTQSSSSGGRR